MPDQRTAVPTSSHPAARTGRHAGWAAALALVAVALAWVATAAALEVADGVTREAPGSTSYRTEFIDPAVELTGGALAVLLVVVAGWFSWRVAAAGLVGVVAALWWGAEVTVGRYAESGWGDGLEVFAFVVPMLAGALGATGILVAAVARRTR